MPDHNEKRKENSKINLLSDPHIVNKWFPSFLRNQHSWQILSGTWQIKSSNGIVYLKQPNVKTGENISVTGSKNWANFNLQIRFKILTESIRPPEGGVVLYFLFSSMNSFYSLHCCIYKQKIELIKRFRGIWSTLAENNHELETNKYYCVTINTNSNVHKCTINGTNVIQTYDADISKGYIGIGIKYCDVEFDHTAISFL